MADRNEGYWSRSWALLTMHDGWIKPVLALAAARLVPIVGPFGADGYALEWGRLTAWGVDAAPKQKGVDIGACIVSGARAFVIALGYGIVLAVLNGVLTTFLGGFGGLLTMVLGAISAILVLVAKLRATIYQSIGAGYQVDRIADMVKRDSNGLLRLIGLSAAVYAVIGVVGGIVLTIAIVAHAGPLVMQFAELENSGYVSDARMMRLVFTMIGGMLPTLFVLGFLLSVVNTVASLVLTTATALWMRQFDVQHWGQSGDPLPGAAAPTAAAPGAGAPGETGAGAPGAAGAGAQGYPQGGAYGGEPTPSAWAGTDPTPSAMPSAVPSAWAGTTPAEAAPQVPSEAAPLAPTDWAMSQPAASDGSVPTLALDDYAPAAPAANAGVPTFTLDDYAPAGGTAPTGPVPQAGDSSVPTFTLDDYAPAAAPTAEPQAQAQPVFEPYQGPVESDEDARKALASLDLPVKPFDSVMGMPVVEDAAAEDATVVEVVDLTAQAAPADAVAPAADADVDAGVQTFSLDDFATPEEPNEAAE